MGLCTKLSIEVISSTGILENFYFQMLDPSNIWLFHSVWGAWWATVHSVAKLPVLEGGEKRKMLRVSLIHPFPLLNSTHTMPPSGQDMAFCLCHGKSPLKVNTMVTVSPTSYFPPPKVKTFRFAQMGEEWVWTGSSWVTVGFFTQKVPEALM